MDTQLCMERGRSARLVVATEWCTRVVSDMILRVGHMLARHILERAYRKAERKLLELDDRMLRDIGLSRSEVASAPRNPNQKLLPAHSVG